MLKRMTNASSDVLLKTTIFNSQLANFPDPDPDPDPPVDPDPDSGGSSTGPGSGNGPGKSE